MTGVELPTHGDIRSWRARSIGNVVEHADPFDDILAAAQHGSEWAWGRILEDIGPGIQGYARSQGSPDPEDILSRVLEGLVRGIGKFKGNRSAFRSWAFTIAHSRIIDERRRRSRRPVIADRELPETAGDGSDPHLSSRLMAREDALALLDGLPKLQRDAVALRIVAGLSVAETARVLRKRPGAVRVATHRGLKALEEKLVVGVTP